MFEKLKYVLFNVRVEGESSWPELFPGNTYFATNIFKPKIGDYIIFENPECRQEIIIKKVVDKTPDFLITKGSVPWSSSFEVPENLVLGKII